MATFTTMASPSSIAKLVKDTDAFLFDCDGVLWHGDAVLPNVVETLSGLRAAGKSVIFVTNNATKSRRQYLGKLSAAGIAARVEEIYCSAYAAAAYFKQIDFQKKVFVVGMGGLEEELSLCGIRHEGGTSYPAVGSTLADASEVALDPDIGAVVIGLDTRLTYAKLAHATCLLRNDASCLFVATNPDSCVNTANGRILPGAGAGIAALQVASGREPVVVGKPEPLLLDIIAKEHSLNKACTVMVGDRLDTDILFGRRGGLKTVLVMTGVTTPDDLTKYKDGGNPMPDFVLKGMADLRIQDS